MNQKMIEYKNVLRGYLKSKGVDVGQLTNTELIERTISVMSTEEEINMSMQISEDIMVVTFTRLNRERKRIYSSVQVTDIGDRLFTHLFEPLAGLIEMLQEG